MPYVWSPADIEAVLAKEEARRFCAYYDITEQVRAELARQGLADLPELLREIKATGDARLYACSSSMAICGVKPDELLPEIDTVRGLTTFLLDDVANADRVLSF